jgi:putative endonuclease
MTRASKICHPERSEGSLFSLMKTYFVYIMTNKSRTLYIGVTNDLSMRVEQHKSKAIPGFTSKYYLDRLVFFEEFDDIRTAIEREKQIKGWLRRKKIALIEASNPRWEDLSTSITLK